MRASDFDFALPPEQIAQVPLARRDDARLLVLTDVLHRQIRDLPSLLPPGTLMILNDTRVIPARLRAHKPTGGRVELLLVEPLSQSPGRVVWRCLGGASKPIRLGPLTLDGAGAPPAEVLAVHGEFVDVAFDVAGDFLDVIATLGEVPLPPYIHRGEPATAREDARAAADRDRYQTVFARVPGAVAAPTAGLHFTPELLAALEARGVAHAMVTLHVGPGTFAPLRADEIAPGQELHAERYEIPEATAVAIAAARKDGRPVLAVGTTVVRTLESAARDDGTVTPGSGSTRLFIRPGHRFAAVDLLLTNFHLPRSSLLMLVSAFAGTARVLDAYAAAVRAGYRFFSYGDAMLLGRA